MVLVESPLWVLHSNANAPPSLDFGHLTEDANRCRHGAASATTGTTVAAAAAEANETKGDTNSNSELKNPATTTTASRTKTKKAQALSSLRNFFANKAPLCRAAIYSVDVCYYSRRISGGSGSGGNNLNTTVTETKRFATGGGDGRVRIWSCDGLFVNVTSKTEDNNSALAHYNEKGGYESGQSNGELSSPSDSEEGATVSNNNDATNSSSSTSSSSKKDDKQQKEQQPRLLATLHTHEGSVLCVRWSHNGKYLASAGDDSHVLLYTRKSSSSAAAGILSTTSMFGGDNNTSAVPNIEHWARIRTCRGHGLDVVGLAWAPDDSHLASCSLDRNSPIIIWKVCDVLPGVSGYDVAQARKHHNAAGGMNIGFTGTSGTTSHGQILQPYKVLGQSIHRSAVKGITWDPVGKYLCSAGDDPAICVWRTSGDWGLEARIDSTSGIFTSGRRNNTSSNRGDGQRVPQASSTTVLTTFDHNNNNNNAHHHNMEDDIRHREEEDYTELANISLFRRISFSPDGSHVCATNATLRNKNIAAMISREGWAVSIGNKRQQQSTSGNDIQPPTPQEQQQQQHHPVGAANLIGHRQPVVASRHCPVLLSVRKKRKRKKQQPQALGPSGKSNDESDVTLTTNGQKPESDIYEDEDIDDDEDSEPKYALLVALGDKRGFVTIWSTKSSRPIFKMQVSSGSSSRCTITDLAWAYSYSNKNRSIKRSNNQGPQPSGLMLLVSMLDGHMAAISLSWDELGGIPLNFTKKQRLFRLRYGLELTSPNDVTALSSPYYMMNGSTSGGRIIGSTGPKLIETPLQLTMEEDLAEKELSTSSLLAAKGQVTNSKQQQRQQNQSASASSPSIKVAASQGGTTANATQSVEDTKSRQVETRKRGKKRIRPVLVMVDDDHDDNIDGVDGSNGGENPKGAAPGATGTASSKKQQDPISKVLDVADKMKTSADELTAKKRKRASGASNTATGGATTSEGERNVSSQGGAGDGTTTTIAAGGGGANQQQLMVGSRPIPSLSLQQQQQQQQHSLFGGFTSSFTNSSMVILPTTDTVLTVKLSLPSSAGKRKVGVSSTTSSSISNYDGNIFLFECTSSSLPSSSPHSSPSVVSTFVISRNNGTQQLFKDIIFGQCTALAASLSSHTVALGTYDGTLYMFRTTGVENNNDDGDENYHAFRSLPPLIFGSPITHIDLYDCDNTMQQQMLVVCSNGDFRLYDLLTMTICQKGSIIPTFQHMSLVAMNHHRSNNHHLQQQQIPPPQPQLTRVQLTPRGIVIIVSLSSSSGSGSGSSTTRTGAAVSSSASQFRSSGTSSSVTGNTVAGGGGQSYGGGLHAFLYNPHMELWQRIADARRFEASYYHINVAMARRMLLAGSRDGRGHSMSMMDGFLDGNNNNTGGKGGETIGPLRELEDIVSLSGTTSSSHFGGLGNMTSTLKHLAHSQPDYREIITRSHCEDRLSCCIALDSSKEFERWFQLYARHLSSTSDVKRLRFLCDMVMGQQKQQQQQQQQQKQQTQELSSHNRETTSSKNDVVTPHEGSKEQAFVDAYERSSQMDGHHDKEEHQQDIVMTNASSNSNNNPDSGDHLIMDHKDDTASSSNKEKQNQSYNNNISNDDKDAVRSNKNLQLWWWIGSSSGSSSTNDRTILGFTRKHLIQLIINEMGRNRELQRFTNEISMELDYYMP